MSKVIPLVESDEDDSWTESETDKPLYIFVMREDRQNMIEEWNSKQVFWTSHLDSALKFTEADKDKLLESLNNYHPEWCDKTMAVLCPAK